MKLTEETRMELSSVEFTGGEASPETSLKQIISNSSISGLDGPNSPSPTTKHLVNGHNGTKYTSPNEIEACTLENGPQIKGNAEDICLGVGGESYSPKNSPEVSPNCFPDSTGELSNNSDCKDIQSASKSPSVCDTNLVEKVAADVSHNSDEFELKLSDDEEWRTSEDHPSKKSIFSSARLKFEENQRKMPTSIQESCVNEGSKAKEKEDSSLNIKFCLDSKSTESIKVGCCSIQVQEDLCDNSEINDSSLKPNVSDAVNPSVDSDVSSPKMGEKTSPELCSNPSSSINCEPGDSLGNGGSEDEKLEDLAVICATANLILEGDVDTNLLEIKARENGPKAAQARLNEEKTPLLDTCSRSSCEETSQAVVKLETKCDPVLEKQKSSDELLGAFLSLEDITSEEFKEGSSFSKILEKDENSFIIKSETNVMGTQLEARNSPEVELGSEGLSNVVKSEDFEGDQSNVGAGHENAKGSSNDLPEHTVLKECLTVPSARGSECEFLSGTVCATVTKSEDDKLSLTDVSLQGIEIKDEFAINVDESSRKKSEAEAGLNYPHNMDNSANEVENMGLEKLQASINDEDCKTKPECLPERSTPTQDSSFSSQKSSSCERSLSCSLAGVVLDSASSLEEGHIGFHDKANDTVGVKVTVSVGEEIIGASSPPVLKESDSNAVQIIDSDGARGLPFSKIEQVKLKRTFPDEEETSITSSSDEAVSSFGKKSQESDSEVNSSSTSNESISPNRRRQSESDSEVNSSSTSNEAISPNTRKQSESDSEIHDKMVEEESNVNEITVDNEVATCDGEKSLLTPKDSLFDAVSKTPENIPASRVDSQECPPFDLFKSNNSSEGTERNLTRKRASSHSDQPDSSKKKVNGLVQNLFNIGKFSSNLSEKQTELGLKRPGDLVETVQTKKVRVKNDKDIKNALAGKTKAPINEIKRNFDFSSKMTDIEEKSRLLRLQKAALDSMLPTKVPEETFHTIKYEPSEPTPLPIAFPYLQKLFKGQLDKLKRSELEEILVQKVCEVITEKSTVGELRLRCQALEKILDKEKEKKASLKKQMLELNIVLKKYIDTVQKVPGISATPIKVTRSVGLQVCQKSAITFGARMRSAPGPYSYRLQSPQPCTSPASKSFSTTPAGRPDDSSIHKPQQPVLVCDVAPHTPTVPSGRLTRPVSSPVAVSSPPALVSTSSQSVLLTLPTSASQVSSKSPITPPRPQTSVPPLRQIPHMKPRLSTPSPVATINPGVMQVQTRQPPPLHIKQSTPPSLNVVRQSTPIKDVEVIDVIDKEDPNKKPGVRANQQLHQKQAANVAAQNLASNSGVTVRLISPQVSQGVTYQQLLVPSQGMQQKMIITSASQTNQISSNVKTIVMKNGNQRNLLIPLQSGVAVSSNVVHMTQTTQQAVQQIFTNANSGIRTTSVPTMKTQQVHPAPLPSGPAQPSNPQWKMLPPRPNLKIQLQNHGIVLSWNMVLGPTFADVESYQLFAYQEGSQLPTPTLWKKVGDVKALPLPMACTLTQFVAGHRYHFAVRAVDVHCRFGPFSQPGSIRLGN